MEKGKRPNNPVDVESVSVDPTSVSLDVGEAVTLTVTVSPENADEKRVSFSSGDASVATVRNGVITAVSPGDTTVSVTSRGNSDISATVAVTINAEPEPEPEPDPGDGEE